MKVAKKNSPVTSANDDIKIDENAKKVMNDGVEQELNEMVLKDATSYIRSAISSLGGLARRTGDAKYKEAIANLSVVLFDLQG